MQVLSLKKNPQITVVMPALNEEKNIRSAVDGAFRSFRRLKVRGELVVVNDGSSDRTEEILDKHKTQHPSLKVLKNERPSGIGGAFLAGVKRAKGDAVVMIPGDNENCIEDILKFLGLLDQVDIIVPFVHNYELRDLWRRVISSLYRFIISFSFGTTLNYYNGTVVYRTTVLRSLSWRSRGFFYQAEILIRALRRGHMFAEVPVLLQARHHGRSKALTLKSLWSVTWDFILLFWDIHFHLVEARAPKSC